MHLLIRLFLGVVCFAATASGEKAASVATPKTELAARREYSWTFDRTNSFGRGRYGLQQWGPVGPYSRNTLIIWRSKAHRIPVTAPWALVIAACVLFAFVGFITLLIKRARR